MYVLLFVLALAATLFAGYGMAGEQVAQLDSDDRLLGGNGGRDTSSWISSYPRLGLIRVDAFDQVLVDVREGMR